MRAGQGGLRGSQGAGASPAPPPGGFPRPYRGAAPAALPCRPEPERGQLREAMFVAPRAVESPVGGLRGRVRGEAGLGRGARLDTTAGGVSERKNALCSDQGLKCAVRWCLGDVSGLQAAAPAAAASGGGLRVGATRGGFTATQQLVWGETCSLGNRGCLLL